jgi:hypothetical protein
MGELVRRLSTPKNNEASTDHGSKLAYATKAILVELLTLRADTSPVEPRGNSEPNHQELPNRDKKSLRSTMLRLSCTSHAPF